MDVKSDGGVTDDDFDSIEIRLGKSATTAPVPRAGMLYTKYAYAIPAPFH